MNDRQSTPTKSTSMAPANVGLRALVLNLERPDQPIKQFRLTVLFRSGPTIDPGLSRVLSGTPRGIAARTDETRTEEDIDRHLLPETMSAFWVPSLVLYQNLVIPLTGKPLRGNLATQRHRVQMLLDKNKIPIVPATRPELGALRRHGLVHIHTTRVTLAPLEPAISVLLSEFAPGLYRYSFALQPLPSLAPMMLDGDACHPRESGDAPQTDNAKARVLPPRVRDTDLEVELAGSLSLHPRVEQAFCTFSFAPPIQFPSVPPPSHSKDDLEVVDEERIQAHLAMQRRGLARRERCKTWSKPGEFGIATVSPG